jgi:hypothetical protein
MKIYLKLLVTIHHLYFICRRKKWLTKDSSAVQTPNQNDIVWKKKVWSYFISKHVTFIGLVVHSLFLIRTGHTINKLELSFVYGGYTFLLWKCLAYYTNVFFLKVLSVCRWERIRLHLFVWWQMAVFRFISESMTILETKLVKSFLWSHVIN